MMHFLQHSKKKVQLQSENYCIGFCNCHVSKANASRDRIEWGKPLKCRVCCDLNRISYGNFIINSYYVQFHENATVGWHFSIETVPHPSCPLGELMEGFRALFKKRIGQCIRKCNSSPELFHNQKWLKITLKLGKKQKET